MSEWKDYIKTNTQVMRPYVAGENMDMISVSEGDVLEEGGMIAINKQDSNDQWYVAKEFFKSNYRLFLE